MFRFQWNKINVVLITTSVVIAGATLLFKYLKRRRSILHHKVYICRNLQEWNNIEDEFYSNCLKHKVVGLDCEWIFKNGKRQPIALMQIATAHEMCVLLRLNKFDSNFPPLLIQILADKSILKVGVDIWSDRKKLLVDYIIFLQGCLDLRHLIKLTPKTQYIYIHDIVACENEQCVVVTDKFWQSQRKNEHPREIKMTCNEYSQLFIEEASCTHTAGKQKSLSGIAEAVLGIKLNKSRSVRCGNWEQECFSSKQIEYAAKDAVIAAQVFEQIMMWRMSRSIKQRLMFYLKEDRLYHEAIILCSDVIDVPYKSGKTTEITECDNDSKMEKPVTSKTSSALIRRKPLYHNCQLQAPDGELLCICDIKKVNWYLEKNLGDLVETDPVTVRLKFEPSGRPVLDNIYYLHKKENRCVCCGKSDSYIRKNIIPHEYRKHFPNLMKDHLSHDVLLLCARCHQKSNCHDLALRRILEKECGAPLESLDNTRIQTNPVHSKVLSAARALKNFRSNMPKERIEQLEKCIQDFYKVKDLTPEILSDALCLDTRILNEEYIPHGQKVVQFVSKNGGLLKFEADWRKHFLDTMKPKYLPHMWSLNHNHERILLQIKKGNLDFDTSILGLEEN